MLKQLMFYFKGSIIFSPLVADFSLLNCKFLLRNLEEVSEEFRKFPDIVVSTR